jgi:AmmeMemoRadiSam system protein B
MGEEKVRKAAFAGTWYPGQATALRSQINSLLDSVSGKTGGGEQAIGLVAPHAGLMYSGRVAACAYRAVQGVAYESILVIAPSHRMPFRGVSLIREGGYETPLGTMAIDGELAAAIVAGARTVKVNPAVHVEEHAVEMQLPFLGVLFAQVPFVPLIMGDQSRETCEDLACSIHQAALGKKILIVASSDLSHFHPAVSAGPMDRLFIDKMSALDPDGLLMEVARGKTEACGAGPVAVTLKAARLLGAAGCRILSYADSGDINGDKRRVVGYTAAVIY